jgi:hypothetical protein
VSADGRTDGQGADYMHKNWYKRMNAKTINEGYKLSLTTKAITDTTEWMQRLQSSFNEASKLSLSLIKLIQQNECKDDRFLSMKLTSKVCLQKLNNIVFFFGILTVELYKPHT